MTDRKQMKSIGTKSVKKVVSITVLLLVLAALFHNAGFPNQTDIYVAPNGSDSNPGTLQQPLLTLEKARDLAAQASKNATRTVNVYLRGGTYFRSTPLTFLPEHSGRSISPIRFLSHPGETATLSGAIRVRGSVDCAWSQPRMVNGLAVHRCTLNPTSAQTQILKDRITQIRAGHNNNKFAITSMFAGNNRRIRSRHPNLDKPLDLSNLRMEFFGNYESRNPVLFGSQTDWGVLPHSIANSGAELIFSNLWQHTRALVAEVSQSGGRNSFRLGDLSMNGALVTFAGSGDEVGRLENHPSFIDSHGEWYFDESALAFDYIPMPGESVQALDFNFPVNARLVELRGVSPTNPVRHIWFENLNFTFSSWVYQNGNGNSKFYAWVQSACGLNGMLDGNFVSHIKVKGSQFSNFGANAISLGGNRTGVCSYSNNSMADNIAISQNTFTDGGGGAIRVDSYKNTTGYLKISSNTIRQYGRVFEDAVGINVLSPPNYSLIQNNLVTQGAYSGISAGWRCRNTASEQILIENNRVEEVMTRLTDGGAIYNNGSQGFILNNYIRSVGENRQADTKRSEPYMFWGIYLDDSSLFWNVSGNTFGSNRAATLIHKLATGFNPLSTHRISDSQIASLSQFYPFPTQPDVSQCQVSNDGSPINRLVSQGSVPRRLSCKVSIQDCPRYSHLAYREVDDSFEDADVDQERCLRRAREYYSYCGAKQEVKVRFMNNSQVIVESTHIERTVPSRPTLTSISVGNTQVSVAFSAPTSDGNSPIISYEAQALRASDQSLVKTMTGLTSPIVISGLTNGTAYVFRIRARNSVGPSEFSSLSSVVIPQAASVPGVPVLGQMTAGNGQVTVAFTAPAVNGGSLITAYEVQTIRASDGVNFKVTTATSSPVVVTGLANGTAYSFKIRARNAVGFGAWSVDSTSVAPLPFDLRFAAGGLTLSAGQTREALNIRLVYRTDGNLTVENRSTGSALWQSNSSNNCSVGCTAVFQSDGNLVLRRNGASYWATNTRVPAVGTGAQLHVTESAPFIRVLDMQFVPIWRGSDINSTSLSFLTDQFFMYPGSDIVASGFQLGFTLDGRLILYRLPGYAILWQSERNPSCLTSPCFAVFQSDANLVLYKGSPSSWANVSSYWWANTVAHPRGSRITFQSVAPFVRITRPDGSQVYPR